MVPVAVTPPPARHQARPPWRCLWSRSARPWMPWTPCCSTVLRGRDQSCRTPPWDEPHGACDERRNGRSLTTASNRPRPVDGTQPLATRTTVHRHVCSVDAGIRPARPHRRPDLRGRGARPALDDRFQGVQRSSVGSAARAGLAVRCGRCAGWRRQRENPPQEADTHAVGCHRHHACHNRGSRSGREMCRTPGAADRTVAP